MSQREQTTTSGSIHTQLGRLYINPIDYDHKYPSMEEGQPMRQTDRRVGVKAILKKAYDNYRDDHDQFRQLTQSAGVLEVKPDSIVVNIMPRASLSPQLWRVIDKVFEAINAQQPVLPDDSSRKLVFRLADRSELKVSLEKGR